MEVQKQKGECAPMSEHTNCMYHYTVRRGDSFYLIAHRLNVQLRDLLEANPDIPPARLTVGDVLCIPYCQDADTPAGDQQGNTDGSDADQPQGNGGTETPNTCPAQRRAVVQDGQTASDFQLRYNLSYHTLRAANPDKDLEDIRGGDVLCVPENNIACPLPASIVLGDNDTLESIAVTYNLPVAAILRVNPCLAPEDFTAGTTVRLPE